MRQNICIIPARGGSTRIPRKNIKLFHGQPIIGHSIEKAQQSELFDRIIVSTDDGEIAEVAKMYEAEVWHRDPAFGANEVGTQDVVAECVDGVGIQIPPTDVVCCLYATVPLMSVHDLTLGYYLLSSMGTAFVLSVGYPPLQDAGQFYWGMARDFGRVPLIGPRTKMVHVDETRVCDINTPEDWARAEQMYLGLEK